MSHMIHRTQGIQLSDKGDDGKNVFQPTRCVRLRVLHKLVVES